MTQPDKRDIALAKINDIRNSIVGFQSVGWSDHIYPLVAALEEAGIAGAGYEKARLQVQLRLDIDAAIERDAARYRFACSVDGERAGLGWGASKEEMDQRIDALIEETT